MKLGVSLPNVPSTPDRRTNEIVASQVNRYGRPVPGRQLKDYPQSLQTAARALWG